MAKPFHMQPLVDLARSENEAAIKKFGQINRHQQIMQEKLDSLLQFRKEYQDRLQAAVRNGMSQSDLSNFQRFIQRLDEAIAQQRAANEQALTLVELGRNEMKSAHRKMKSFDTLANRHVQSEKKRIEKTEQRQQDEHVNRTAAVRLTAALHDNNS
jgi:flagellar FliJ protein